MPAICNTGSEIESHRPPSESFTSEHREFIGLESTGQMGAILVGDGLKTKHLGKYPQLKLMDPFGVVGQNGLTQII